MCKWTTAEIQGPYQQAAIIRHPPSSAIRHHPPSVVTSRDRKRMTRFDFSYVFNSPRNILYVWQSYTSYHLHRHHDFLRFQRLDEDKRPGLDFDQVEPGRDLPGDAEDGGASAADRFGGNCECSALIGTWPV